MVLKKLFMVYCYKLKTHRYTIHWLFVEYHKSGDKESRELKVKSLKLGVYPPRRIKFKVGSLQFIRSGGGGW